MQTLFLATTCLETISSLSTIIACVATVAACIVAIVTLRTGIKQFEETQSATREAQAVDLFAKFNQMNSEPDGGTNEESRRWKGNGKFAITEALYEIRKEQSNWLKTIKWMLCQQKDFIDEGDFELDTYSDDFRSFCENSGYKLRREKKS